MGKIVFRNGQKILGTLASGTGDNVLTINVTSKDITSISPLGTPLSSALPSAQVFVGSNLGIATPRALTGILSISNVGFTDLVANTVTNTHINVAANIAVSKLAAGTNGQILTIIGSVPTWGPPPSAGVWGSITGTIGSQSDLIALVATKQDTLISNTNIKTVNGTSLLGSGNVGVGVTSIDVGGGTTGLTTSGGPITTSGTITLAGTLAIANGGTGTTTGLPLNSIIAATGSSSINNAANTIQFQWNTLAGASALTLSSTSTLATGNANAILNISTSGANGTSTQTTYGGIFRNTKTGTSSTNIAGSFGASGGTTNIALEVTTGAIRTPLTAGRLALITTSGDITTDASLLWTANVVTLGTSSSGGTSYTAVYNTTGGAGVTRYTSGATNVFQVGANSLGTYGGSANNLNGTSWSILDMQASLSRAGMNVSGDLFIGPSNASFGFKTTQAGVINIASTLIVGSIGAITAGSVLVDFVSTTLGILMPRVTNIASVATPVAGMIAYDAATNKFNFRENAAWVQLGGGGGITNGAANNELMKSDGTNAVASGIFASTNGSPILGSGSISGSRTVTVSSSTTNASLTLVGQGTGSIFGTANAVTNNLLYLEYVTESTTSRTLTEADRGRVILCTNAGTTTITLANGLTQGFSVTIVKSGSGTVNITSPTTLNVPGGSASLTTLYAHATFHHTGSNVWDGSGQFGPSGIVGSTGSTDNIAVRSDGTGGFTIQASPLAIADDGTVTSTASLAFVTTSGNAAIYLNDGSGNITLGQVGLTDYLYFNTHTINPGGSATNIPITLIPKGNSSVDLRGTTTNGAAPSGYVGEEVAAIQSTYTNYTTTATYQNITSITLTAGDWDLDTFFTYSSNSATITAAANAIFVVSTTTASASGATEGLNISYVPQAALLGTSKFSDAIPSYRVSITGSTTYYLNSQATFTLGNPQFVGGIRARRIR